VQRGEGATVLVLMLLLAGPVTIGFSIYEAAHHRRLLRAGVRAEGMVVRHRRQSSAKGGTAYFAVVNFVDAQGIPHEFEANSSGVRGLPVGGRAPVVYLPGAPESARLDLSGRRLASILVPLGGGILFTAVGIWMLSTGR
jgi:hypothetical protein